MRISSSLDPRGLSARHSAHAPLLGSLVPIVVLMALAGLPGWASDSIGRDRYLSVSPDPRDCLSPACGGFWLEAVNQSETTCADGSQQASCYVASADFGALEAPPTFGSGELVVRGRIDAEEYPYFGNLGRLVTESAWTGATPRSVEDMVYRIRDLGLVCVMSPCFSLEARVLNQTDTFPVSRLDLRAVDATPEQLAAAEAAVRRGDLLVAATTGPDPGPAGEGLALIASQLFLPEPARPRCYSDAECVLGTRCNAVEVCLAPPGCEPGDPCPTVCSGYCAPAACGSNADCAASQYCSGGGLCRSDGSCGLEVDCSLPGNDYPHIECVGHGTCDALETGGGACGWACTNPSCVDLLGFDFGPCDAVLGWGVVGGVCADVSGCDPDPFALFASHAECAAACAVQPSAVPALDWPAALALGLGLSTLAIRWIWRRVSAPTPDPR